MEMVLDDFEVLSQSETQEIDGGVTLATACAVWTICVAAGTLCGMIYHKYFCDGGHN